MKASQSNIYHVPLPSLLSWDSFRIETWFEFNPVGVVTQGSLGRQTNKPWVSDDLVGFYSMLTWYLLPTLQIKDANEHLFVCFTYNNLSTINYDIHVYVYF